MSNCEFKVGDRVLCTSNDVDEKNLKGERGTIIHMDYDDCDSMLVEFDKDIDGHAGGGKGKLNHCWWVRSKELEPICKFKVGDYVIGNSCEYSITSKGWIGKVTKLRDNGTFDAKGRGVTGREVTFEELNPHCFDLYTKDQPDKIVITTDGSITTAKLYRDKQLMEVQTTKCHPDDRFDFIVGARIAFNRLVGTPTGEKKEEPEKLKYKIGDKVIIESTNIDGIDDKFRGSVGEIINVDPTYRYPYLVRNHTSSPKREELWSTVSGYAPTYYNGKVVCVGNSGDEKIYTKGKVYQFVDGQLIHDKGRKFPFHKVKSFEEWQDWSSAEWLEVVE